MTKTVAGLFRTYDDAQSAVNGLLGAGFDRTMIDLLANNEGEYLAAGEGGAACDSPVITGEAIVGETLVGAGEGAVIGGLTGLAVGLATLLIPGVGPVLAIGPLAGVLAGAELGALGGGILAAFTGLGLTQCEARHYAEGIRRGGALVTVRVEGEGEARRAADELDRHAPIDLSWGTWASFSTEAAKPTPRHEVRSGYATPSNDPDDYADEESLTGNQHATEVSGIRAYAARL